MILTFITTNSHIYFSNFSHFNEEEKTEELLSQPQQTRMGIGSDDLATSRQLVCSKPDIDPSTISLHQKNHPRSFPRPDHRNPQRSDSQTSSAKFICCLVVTRILQHREQTLKSTGQEEFQHLRGRCPGERPSPRKAPRHQKLHRDCTTRKL